MRKKERLDMILFECDHLQKFSYDLVEAHTNDWFKLSYYGMYVKLSFSFSDFSYKLGWNPYFSRFGRLLLSRRPILLESATDLATLSLSF